MSMLCLDTQPRLLEIALQQRLYVTPLCEYHSAMPKVFGYAAPNQRRTADAYLASAMILPPTGRAELLKLGVDC